VQHAGWLALRRNYLIEVLTAFAGCIGKLGQGFTPPRA